MRALTFIAVALACLFVSVVSLRAQPRRSVIISTEAERDLANRQWELRHVGKIEREVLRTQPQRISLLQVREDYRRIQVINNEMLYAAGSGQALNYKSIADAMSDLKKRAARLKQVLMLPEAVDDDKGQRKPLSQDDRELKQLLRSLDELIVTVITNPVFKNFGVVDVQQTAKARHDLEEIVQLSGVIKKSAERLSKATTAQQD
jgi:hypothetical protein